MEEMNIHPIVIHFPIAFLTIYAMAEILRFRFLLEKPYWWNVKKVLVLIGWVGSFIAALTGLITTQFHISGPRIFMMHELFALLTIIFSTLASILYLKNRQGRVLILLAAFILISITITGGLGAAMVRGTHFDPLMKPIFILLGVY
jgi:uncharacterized membrane protein